MNYQLTPIPSDEVGGILLVDDDPTNLDILRETLGGPNYRLFMARSGEEALKVARRVQPLIVLLDVVMPGIDGYETCRRLKEDPETRDAAVIFLSALNSPTDKVRGFEAGAVDFITKPVQAEEVIARVNTHLRIQRLLRRQLQGVTPAGPLVRSGDDATGAGKAEARVRWEPCLSNWGYRRISLPHRPLPCEGRNGRALRGGGPRIARADRAQDDPVAHRR